MDDSKRDTVLEAVRKIEIKKKGTPEGDAQREAFRIRYGIKLADLSRSFFFFLG